MDDDGDLSFVIKDMLESYGYDVAMAADAREAFGLLESEKFHLILLDINLPDETGFEVCVELRRRSKIPVIFASARTGENDKVRGLDIGGDDYLEKPYSLKELLARVNALMRRTYGGDEEGRVYQLGRVTVDAAQRRVVKDGAEVHMALKEFDVLHYLCAHMGKAVRKEELLHEVWGIFAETELSTVAVHIRWLREKLEDDPSAPKLIQTVWGVGYQICSGGNSDSCADDLS